MISASRWASSGRNADRIGGTGLVGGPEDLDNFVKYLQAYPDLTAPKDRVNGL